jgi:glutaredoxin-like YruB-family protein
MSVKIYSTETCTWCMKTKEYLKKHKIKYQDINVGENQKAAKEMIEKSGQTGVPVIDIGGKIIVGFDEPAIKKALKIK